MGTGSGVQSIGTGWSSVVT